jgi:hypothetical protein
MTDLDRDPDQREMNRRIERALIGLPFDAILMDTRPINPIALPACMASQQRAKYAS